MSFILKITLLCKFNKSQTLSVRLTDIAFQLASDHQLAQSYLETSEGLDTELHAKYPNTLIDFERSVIEQTGHEAALHYIAVKGKLYSDGLFLNWPTPCYYSLAP